MLLKKNCILILITWCFFGLIYLFLFSTVRNLGSTAPQHKSILTQDKNPETSDTIEITTEKKSENFTITEYIFTMNNLQKIYNGDINSSEIDLVIVVQTHDRLQYFKQLIKSFEEAPGIQNTLLIFSHDVVDKNINDAVSQIKFAKVMQIFYPLSIQAYPGEFPGLDAKDCPPGTKENDAKKRQCKNYYYRDGNGNFRDPFVTQIKHHWWWKINFVFNRVRILKDYEGLVMLLEEDHYLAPDFIHSLNLMKKHADEKCPQCVLFSLGFHDSQNFRKDYNRCVIQNRMENYGLTFNRSTWNEIVKYSEFFCKYDDYNWDWTLNYVLDLMKPVPLSMVMGASRVSHIGLCGIHYKDSFCDPTLSVKNYKKEQTNLFPKSLRVVDEVGPKDPVVNNGGWSDPRDQALCMGMGM